MKLEGREVDVETVYKRLLENYDLYALLDATSAEKDALGTFVCQHILVRRMNQCAAALGLVQKKNQDDPKEHPGDRHDI